MIMAATAAPAAPFWLGIRRTCRRCRASLGSGPRRRRRRRFLVIRLVPASALQLKAGAGNQFAEHAPAFRAGSQGGLGNFLRNFQGLLALLALVLVNRHVFLGSASWFPEREWK